MPLKKVPPGNLTIKETINPIHSVTTIYVPRRSLLVCISTILAITTIMGQRTIVERNAHPSSLPGVIIYQATDNNIAPMASKISDAHCVTIVFFLSFSFHG